MEQNLVHELRNMSRFLRCIDEIPVSIKIISIKLAGILQLIKHTEIVKILLKGNEHYENRQLLMYNNKGCVST